MHRHSFPSILPYFPPSSLLLLHSISKGLAAVDFTVEPESQGLDAFSSARAVLSSAKKTINLSSAGSNGATGDLHSSSNGVRPPPSPISALPKNPVVRPPAYSDAALSLPSSSAPLSPSSYASPINPPRQAPIPPFSAPSSSSSSALNMDQFLSSFGAADRDSNTDLQSSWSGTNQSQPTNASSLRKVGTVPKGPSPGPVTPAPLSGAYSGGPQGEMPARGVAPGMGMAMGMGMGGGGVGSVPTAMYNSQMPAPQAPFISPQQYPQYPTQSGMGSIPSYQNSQTQGQIPSMGPGSPSVGGQGGGMVMGMSGGYQQPNNLYQQQNNLYQQQSPGFQQQSPSYQQPMQFSPPPNTLPFNSPLGMNMNTNMNTNMNMNNNMNNINNNSGNNRNINISSMTNAGSSGAKDDDPFGFLQ
jgi:hypothetical protein